MLKGGISIDGDGQLPADLEEKGREIHLRGLDEEDLYFEDADGKHAITMTIVGTYSHRYRAAEQMMQTRRLKRRKAIMTGEQLVRENNQLLVTCVIGWSGFISKGKPIDCNRTNILKIFELYPHIRLQVQQEVEDHEAFFRNASASS